MCTSPPPFDQWANQTYHTIIFMLCECNNDADQTQTGGHRNTTTLNVNATQKGRLVVNGYCRY
jgi:hypothetical protein